MIRILHSVSNMDRAGIETMLMNYYRHIDRSKMKNEINYDAVYRVINEKRQSSKQYLKDAIGMAKQ